MKLKVGERYKTYPKGLCILCGFPKADGRVTIETNSFRGDDLVYKAHWGCLSKLKDTELLVKLFEKE